MRIFAVACARGDAFSRRARTRQGIHQHAELRAGPRADHKPFRGPMEELRAALQQRSVDAPEALDRALGLFLAWTRRAALVSSRQAISTLIGTLREGTACSFSRVVSRGLFQRCRRFFTLQLILENSPGGLAHFRFETRTQFMVAAAIVHLVATRLTFWPVTLRKDLLEL
jgi:hypothetical protein